MFGDWLTDVRSSALTHPPTHPPTLGFELIVPLDLERSVAWLDNGDKVVLGAESDVGKEEYSLLLLGLTPVSCNMITACLRSAVPSPDVHDLGEHVVLYCMVHVGFYWVVGFEDRDLLRFLGLTPGYGNTIAACLRSAEPCWICDWQGWSCRRVCQSSLVVPASQKPPRLCGAASEEWQTIVARWSLLFCRPEVVCTISLAGLEEWLAIGSSRPGLAGGVALGLLSSFLCMRITIIGEFVNLCSSVQSALLADRETRGKSWPSPMMLSLRRAKHVIRM